MSAKIGLYVLQLEPPYDEGFKNFTYNLFREAPDGRSVLRLGHGAPEVIDVQVGVNRLGVNRALREGIRGFKPQAIVYVPAGPVTVVNFIRAKMLRWYAGGAPLAMVCLQPPRSSALLLRALKAIAPNVIYAQSESGRKILSDLGYDARIVRSGADSNRFRPADADEKARLRAEYGIDPSAYVVLHVGHLNEGRNLRVLGELAERQPVCALVVGSTSTAQDASLADWLRGKGVRIIDSFIERIEDVYRLADLYLFPVIDHGHAVEIPLSVLEAMACDLPVVTTRFGGLPECFQEGDGLYFADSSAEVLEKIEAARESGEVQTRAKMADYTWSAVADEFFAEVDELAERGSGH